jgi:mRNA-degrading endonuclease YafQ of YafQ-DinJ toxin-antitoxin module
MQNISKIVFTDLFWEKLGEHRGHAKYAEFRAAIKACIKRKVDDRTFTSNGDKPFSADPILKGIWHCALSKSPDLILFYRLSGDTMICAMLGSHHDYGFKGKNLQAGHNTVVKIDRSIERGHQPIGNWQDVRWNKPSDILNSVDIHEASKEALDRILIELHEENETYALLERANGNVDVNDLSEDIYGPWIMDLEAAKERIRLIQADRRQILKDQRDYTPARFGFGG